MNSRAHSITLFVKAGDLILQSVPECIPLLHEFAMFCGGDDFLEFFNQHDKFLPLLSL